MNYLRISLIDPSAKSSVCMDLSFDPTSVNGTMAAGKRYLSEESQGDTKNTCDTYVLIYAYTIAALLSSFIMITYAAATIYLDRIILRSLTVDRINAPGRYAYEESLVIMIRKDKMLAHGIMNQLISDKIKTKSTMNNSKNNNLTLSSIIAESKEQQLMEAHQDSLSNSSLITNVIGTVTDLLKGPIVKSFDKMSVLEEANLSKIFLFNRPKLFFGAVEAILLLQCFYISMVATQLIPLALISFHNAAWIVGFLIPIGFNFMIIQMLLNKAVLLRAVHTLEREVAGGVCEDAVEEKHAISNLREAVKIKFEEEEIPECEQKTYLYGYFFRYDVKRKNLIDQSDFRKILGDLRIYMSRESFHILWQAVDFDLSGELDWNEIEEIFFPKSKMIPLLEEIIDDDSKDSLPAINQLRKSLHKMLSDQKIPAFDWDVFLHAAFDKYDTDQSGQLDMEELKDMLVSLKVEISAELLMIVFRKFDREENGLVSFNEFFTFFFPSETV